MKNISILFIILSFFSCNTSPSGTSNPDTSVPSGPVDSSFAVKPDTPPPSANDNSVFVGVFASWADGSGATSDGHYDSIKSLFSLCGTASVEPVPASQITYHKFGSCDGTAQKIMLMQFRPNGSFDSEATKVQLKGNDAILQDGSDRQIRLKPVTLQRIKAMNVQHKN